LSKLSSFYKILITQWRIVDNLHLREYHHISTFEDFDKYGNDIEVIHTEIEQRLKDYLQSNEDDKKTFKGVHLCFKAYTELIFLFSSVINEIQNGPVSKPHVNLVKILSADDVIITFNWDTLIDKALKT
jgi:hypothetical protein